MNMTICTTALTGVHSLCSRATFEPVAFQNKTRDQANFLPFTVKRPFHNEISLKPGVRCIHPTLICSPVIAPVGQEVRSMLQTGDLVPHFAVTTFSGESFDYSDIWQRKNLVLVLLSHADSAATSKFVDQLTAQMSELTGDDSACVITRDSVSGVPSPGIVVADRWGEIHHVAEGKTVDDLPGPDDLIEWLRYVQHQCPECEGEAR